MKRLFTFLSLAAFCCSATFAQVTLTKESHGFVAGEKHQSVEVDYQEPGTAGEGMVWDFSQASILEDKEGNESYILNHEAVGNVMISRNDGISFFYDNTEAGNTYLGYTSAKQELTYTRPIQKTNYPQSLGTYFDGDFTGTVINKVNKQSSQLIGTYSTHGDATGTIILPNGKSFEALRIHTTEKIDFGSYYYITDKYLWYAQDIRYPVFVSMESYAEMKDGAIGCSKLCSYMNNKLNSIRKAPTAFEDIPIATDYSIAPNPFDNEIRISYALPEACIVSIELFDASGNKLTTLVDKQKQEGSLSLSQNIANYTSTSGIYFLKLTFGDKTYTEKIIKN